MAKRGKQSKWSVVVLLVIAVLLWLKGELPKQEGSEGRVERGAESAIHDPRYERIEGCRWVDHRQNDGDSFRLKLPDGRVEEIRVYFVDAPESAFKSYGGGQNNHERIGKQAQEMGVTPERAVEVGVAAKKWVHERLAGEALTIFTEWDDPFGDKRYHAFVAMPGGGWLHERLVEEGMVRIHTKGADLPGGPGKKEQERHLEGMEKVARGEGKGIWAR